MSKKLSGAVCLGALLVGCGGGSGHGVALRSVAASTSAVAIAPATSASLAPLPAPEVVPLIVLHGHGGSPRSFGPFLERYGPGFVTVPELCAAQADQLKPGDLPKACVVVASYYKESKNSVKYDLVNGQGTGSIGGCPAPRTDGFASLYPVSYAERLARIVEGVRRATGSDRVDLACHSMGNLVGRAYARWLSDGARAGTSKVRRMLCLAGPHRGINALEAFADGFESGAPREFMRLGENAEMCYEYAGWQGRSYIERLDEDWDAVSAAKDIRYGGVSATGAFGPQEPPPPPPAPPSAPSPHPAAPSAPAPPPPSKGPFGLNLTGPFQDLWTAIQNVNTTTFPEAIPYLTLFVPRIAQELPEALGPSDGTVRLASSRMDEAPFLGRDFYATFEGRHGSEWNPEQAVHASEFTAELARQYLLGTLGAGTLRAVTLRLVDAPGKASWVAVETSVTGGSLVTVQLVEEKLDAAGQVRGGATSYAAPVPEGEQRVFFRVPAGGGKRAYHLVVYGPSGPVTAKDATFTLTDGALEDAPSTTFVGATPSNGAVHATFASNAQDPTLRFSFRLDEGAWTPWTASASFDTPVLAPGEHRVDARAQHGANGAGLVADDARGVSIGILVDSGGAVTIRR